ncbi:MAG: hypothetical protein AAFO29_08490, partial [Actinomycetota bacterium]
SFGDGAGDTIGISDSEANGNAFGDGDASSVDLEGANLQGSGVQIGDGNSGASGFVDASTDVDNSVDNSVTEVTTVTNDVDVVETNTVDVTDSNVNGDVGVETDTDTAGLVDEDDGLRDSMLDS